MSTSSYLAPLRLFVFESESNQKYAVSDPFSSIATTPPEYSRKYSSFV